MIGGSISSIKVPIENYLTPLEQDLSKICLSMSLVWISDSPMLTKTAKVTDSSRDPNGLFSQRRPNMSHQNLNCNVFTEKLAFTSTNTDFVFCHAISIVKLLRTFSLQLNLFFKLFFFAVAN